ncbi:hypothetical protein A3J15_02345 [Candidatus Roizmanbacteria bacterium RIFCSPLOWO2_02_FULL_38_10]|uniref:Metalloenzyme domain-containing protein n=1 Tax=Candidatus Roizmanbacteria bacterium RIFCSPLOWO2_02_FULL_38_10 TaxID=1802074 RepID=A0A1F7JMB6_9BACT|nr:MAG: hypothetical protein A3J15_02345 [Candidatus Roizmanbacteria bacterium RIFCSPLOWO2_02_FULL_38_10]
MSHRIIFIVFDGLGDRPIPALNNLTPLEAAQTPNLDALAKIGINGLIHTIERSIRPGSDVAHLSLFGYDPRKYYRGRGPFEAAGIGMILKPGDIAFRGNVSTQNEKGIIIDRRAGRIDSVENLAKSINNLKIDDVTVHAKAGVGHRIAIVLRGLNLSDEITDTDPHHLNSTILNSRPKNDTKQAKKTADIVNQLTQKVNQIFAIHPVNENRRRNKLPEANCLLLRGAGIMTDFPPFKEKYGFNACCIAGGGLYKGIARILGMDIIEVKGATGKPKTNPKSKIQSLIENFDNYDFFFIHFKGADTCAEDGDYLGKKEYLEYVDKELSPVVKYVYKNQALCIVTGDHSTSSRLKSHTADEVPVLVAGLDVRVDDVFKMGERSAQRGGLGHIDGRHLMRYIDNIVGKEPLYGN